MVQNTNLLPFAREALENTAAIPKEFTNPSFKEAPLTALSSETVRKLSNLLNNIKIIHSHDGYERDWRGLANLSEQGNLYNECNIMHNDPFKRVIEQWCEHNPSTATFGNLVKYLGQIDRWHVIEDVENNFLKDFQTYQTLKQQPIPKPTDNKQNKIVELPRMTNNKEMLESSLKAPTTTAAAAAAAETLTYETKTKILTSNDAQRQQKGLPLETYNAFLLYADADYDYALEILLKLQNNFTFCLKDDLLFGIPFEHIALMELIRERCQFLIAILTKEFTKSPENRFFVNYAQALQIKQEIRKVIPLIYEDQVEVPANLAMFSRMRYNPNRTDLYWSKLADSMQLMELNEGVPRFSATFQRSLINNRPRLRNLAIEASSTYATNKKETAANIPSSKHKKVARKQKFITTRNRGTCKISSLEALEATQSVSLASSSCRSIESRGLIKKLFCCH